MESNEVGCYNVRGVGSQAPDSGGTGLNRRDFTCPGIAHEPFTRFFVIFGRYNFALALSILILLLPVNGIQVCWSKSQWPKVRLPTTFASCPAALSGIALPSV